MQFPAVINRRRMDDLWISAIAIAFGVVAGLLIALVRMLRLPVDRPAAGGLYQSGPRDAAGDAGAISVPFPRWALTRQERTRRHRGADA